MTRRPVPPSRAPPRARTKCRPVLSRDPAVPRRSVVSTRPLARRARKAARSSSTHPSRSRPIPASWSRASSRSRARAAWTADKGGTVAPRGWCESRLCTAVIQHHGCKSGTGASMRQRAPKTSTCLSRRRAAPLWRRASVAPQPLRQAPFRPRPSRGRGSHSLATVGHAWRRAAAASSQRHVGMNPLPCGL